MNECRKCSLEKIRRYTAELEDEGYTWEWTPTGETRKRWWFGNKIRLQRKEVRITMPPEMYPLAVFRWKTYKKIKK